MKAVDIRRKNYEDRYDCAESLHALDHVAAADLLNELFEEAKRQLLGDHIRHKECAALRFADLVQMRRELRLYLRSRKIT